MIKKLYDKCILWASYKYAKQTKQVAKKIIISRFFTVAYNSMVVKFNFTIIFY